MSLFSDIIILDLTRVFSWPFCTRYFADYGAKVIKIENTTNYDEARDFPPIVNWKSWYFEQLNRNKKSITLDLKNNIDLKKFYKLVKKADIIIENFSPNIKNKLKIDYSTLKNINSKIIYTSISWYWTKIDKKAYDVVIQAESWIASVNGQDKPLKNATAIIDAFTWMSACFAISSALYNREKTNKWEFIDVSMLWSSLHLLENLLVETSITWQNPSLSPNHDSATFPFGFFESKDWYVVLAIGNNKNRAIFKNKFLSHLENNYTSNQERLSNKNFLIKEINNSFLNLNTEEILESLKEKNIACAKINNIKEVLNNKELIENNNLKEINHPELWNIKIAYENIKFASNWIQDYNFAPNLWQDNKEILWEMQ